MSDHDRRKEMIAAAAVAMARQNVAKAAAMFGERQPYAPAAAPVASPPAPVRARDDVLVKEAARRRAEREAAEAKASMARVVARMNGKEVKDPSRLETVGPGLWRTSTKRNGAAATDEKPAELSGWARVIARMNARGGR